MSRIELRGRLQAITVVIAWLSHVKSRVVAILALVALQKMRKLPPRMHTVLVPFKEFMVFPPILCCAICTAEIYKINKHCRVLMVGQTLMRRNLPQLTRDRLDIPRSAD